MIRISFFYRVVLIISLILNGYAVDFEQFVRNHSFVFISGWPQSGTSFIHQVFSLHKDVSTMVEKCENRLGKRCINWNHEGQWLIPGKAREFLNSGAMCPHQGNLTTEQKTLIMSEWEQYWSLDRIFLVEKSPQSMLKIPLLRELFKSAISVKFIIITKHPVTLNIATPKSYTWTYHSIKPSSSPQQQVQGSKPVLYEKKKLTPLEQHQISRFFVDLMIHDNSTIYNERDPRCSMGWLPAMKRLHQQLQADVHSRKDVRIVRFESFSSPRSVCKALLAFALTIPSNEYTTTNTNGSTSNKYPIDASTSSKAYITQLCDKHFTSTTTASTTTTSSTATTTSRSFSKPLSFPGNSRNSGNSRKGSIRTSQHRYLLSNNSTNSTQLLVENTIFLQNNQHRALRLRTIQEQKSVIDFHFIPELVAERGRLRVAEFLTVYRSIEPIIRVKLDAISSELKLFGYNLLHWQTRSAYPSILARWEL